MLANFQDGVKGTNRGQTGFFAYCGYRREETASQSKTYSPYLKEYKNDVKNKFSFEGVNFK